MNANTPVATATSNFVAEVKTIEQAAGLVKPPKRTRVPVIYAAPLVRALQILEDNAAVQRAARASQDKADKAKALIVQAVGDAPLVLIGDKKVAVTRTPVQSYTVAAYEKVQVKQL